MKKTITLLSIILLVVIVYSCKKNTTDTFNGTTVTLDLPATPYQYFNDTFAFIGFVNTGNFSNVNLNQMATLGRVLFYDTHLSMNNATACASCHKQALAFADDVAFSTGFQGMLTKRNSIAITDENQARLFFWDGRENDISALALKPLTNHVEMGIVDSTQLAFKLASIPYYAQLFINTFGDPQITTARIAASIGVFVQAINSDSTRLDQFNSGNVAVFTAQEIAGKMLFDTKYPCGSCHNGGGGIVPGGGGAYGGGGGTTFLDIGLDATYTDMGHGTITGVATDNGTFKVPNLRNVAMTAPYMHDGRFKTLSDVIDHYSTGIQQSPNLDSRLMDSTGHAMKMNITADEKQSIIAFLGTLTDYQTLTDPKFSNPFKVN